MKNYSLLTEVDSYTAIDYVNLYHKIRSTSFDPVYCCSISHDNYYILKHYTINIISNKFAPFIFHNKANNKDYKISHSMHFLTCPDDTTAEKLFDGFKRRVFDPIQESSNSDSIFALPIFSDTNPNKIESIYIYVSF